MTNAQQFGQCTEYDEFTTVSELIVSVSRVSVIRSGRLVHDHVAYHVHDHHLRLRSALCCGYAESAVNVTLICITTQRSLVTKMITEQTIFPIRK